MFRCELKMVSFTYRSRAALRAERENGESIVTKSENQHRQLRHAQPVPHGNPLQIALTDGRATPRRA